LYVIIAIIGGSIYASSISWQTLDECETNLKPVIEYLIAKTGNPRIEERCIDIENAGHFILKSSTPFIFFPYDSPPSIMR
jgi:hypothetical protein